MIKLVAFDWNGTILSDTNAVVRAESEVLKHFGHPPTNLKEYHALFTIPIRSYWIAMGLDPVHFDENSAEIERIFLYHYEPEESKCRARSGAREILSWLKANEIDRVIFSNHIVPHIQKQLVRLKLEHLVDTVLARKTGERTHHHNNFKDKMLCEYVQAHNFSPQEVITVGDTIEEIEIGKKFGYHTVALTGGYQNTKRLRIAKPDHLIANLADIQKIIQNIN